MSQLLKPGDVTVVESDRGFHVVKVDEVIHDVEFTKLRAGGEDRGWQGKTYSLITMGCQMNAADSERLEGGLLQLGMVEFEEGARRKPDVVVLNTCSIRERAEHKVYSALGPHARRKQRGEDVVIIVAGCVAQQEGERLARRVPEVDVVMGPQYAGRLLDILEKATMGQQVVATAAAYHAEALNAPRRGSEVVAWVNVAHGCNERCTYCVVPATRGVEQSREPSAILAELAGLGASGFQEATLLGAVSNGRL
ncbi:hypothetical protein M885DRAFT_135444 [Pelagophyceae sp. CCMP2097]|nr:hypothetical protein M885DRAFT_135444 [Pelagophyceae sp. CCMP2097]